MDGFLCLMKYFFTLQKEIKMQEAIILSMTKSERKNPNLLNASRKKRIAYGSGTSIQQVNILFKQFQQIGDMMKKVSKMDKKSLIRGNLSKFFS